MSVDRVSVAPLSWRRVGALSATLNLHGVAIVVATLTLVAPGVLPEQAQLEPILIAEIVEPPPLEAPAPWQREAIVTPPLDQVDVPPLAREVRTAVTAIDAPKVPVATSSLADVSPLVPSVETADAGPARQATVAYESVRAPAYPPVARRNGVEGETLLRVRVGADGRAERVELARSSGDRQLDRAALLAVRHWRFHPAVESGIAIAAWVEVPVSFKLDRR